MPELPLAHPQVPISEVHMPKLHEPRFQEAPTSTQSRGAWLESPMRIRQVTNSSGQLPMSPPPPINRCTWPHTNKGSKEKAIWGGSISPSHMDPAQAPQAPSGTSINQIEVTTRSEFHPARHIDINFQQDSSANLSLGGSWQQPITVSGQPRIVATPMTSTKCLHQNESLSINISMRPESQMKPADLEEGSSVQALPSHTDDGNHMHVDEVNSPVSSLCFLGLDEDNNERAGVEGQLEKRDFSQFLDSIDKCLKLLELLPELFERIVRGNLSNPHSSNPHVTSRRSLPEPKSCTKSEDENSYNRAIRKLMSCLLTDKTTDLICGSPSHSLLATYSTTREGGPMVADFRLAWAPKASDSVQKGVTSWNNHTADVFVTKFKTQHLAGEFLGHNHWNDKWLEPREIKARFSQRI
ncbi:hypothetical protein K439DRAFT_1616407 [Ramaria rubella]|nr:hypothetical protein K439DRAFT_1616407 [Ramaria rubella]